MAGFSSVTDDESIIYGDNVSFNGTKRGGKVTTNGQLLIGSSVSPKIRVGNITSTGGTITVTNGNGTINLENASSGVPKVGFLAVASSQANVTGDSTQYTVQFATEIFDTGGNFAASIFTAPYTGVYLFGSNIEFNTLGAAHTAGGVQITTTASPFASINSSCNLGAIRDVGNFVLLSGSVLVPMTAGNTARIIVAVYNGTKTVGVGTNVNLTSFWGHLVYQTP